jgi:hypothetical protein
LFRRGLSIENPEIKVLDESLLIGIIKDNDGKPRKDVSVDLAIFDSKVASFKKKEGPYGKKTDSNVSLFRDFKLLKKEKL